METIQIENVTRGITLVSRGRAADNAWTRLRGLIGGKPLQDGEGMLIVPCQSIHTHFMSFPIDALYISPDQQVVGADREMKPWRFGRLHRKARAVLELPAGAIGRSDTQVGDQLRILNYRW